MYTIEQYKSLLHLLDAETYLLKANKGSEWAYLIEESIAEIKANMSQIEGHIQDLQDDTLKSIAYMHYIENKPIKEIADIIHYSERTIHNRLKDIEALLNIYT